MSTRRCKKHSHTSVVSCQELLIGYAIYASLFIGLWEPPDAADPSPISVLSQERPPHGVLPFYGLPQVSVDPSAWVGSIAAGMSFWVPGIARVRSLQISLRRVSCERGRSPKESRKELLSVIGREGGFGPCRVELLEK